MVLVEHPAEELGLKAIAVVEHDLHDDRHVIDWRKLRENLGAPDPSLFPPHYLSVVFPKIGGKLLTVSEKDELACVILCFPDSSGGYTGRVHLAKSQDEGMSPNLPGIIRKLPYPINLYYPSGDHEYKKTEEIRLGQYSIGRPSKEEAEKIPYLQAMIWGVEDRDYLYPSDIHSDNFGLPASFVARDKSGEPIGFLFGLHKNVDGKLAQESQLMGFMAEHRGKGLGYELKRLQAQRSLEQGVALINWTYDPLQLSNARINIGKLRGVASDHYEDYYPFSNELNQVAASRFSVSWHIGSNRVQSALQSSQKTKIVDLSDSPEVEKLLLEELPHFGAVAHTLAFEIPVDWNSIQAEATTRAQDIRARTDSLFQHYLGNKGQGYSICDVGTDGDRWFLIARKHEIIPGL